MDAEITPAHLDAAGATVVDVRRDDEWAAGHLAGAVHIPLPELQDRAGEIADPVVFYCQSGTRSEMAAAAFRASGREAASLAGGIERWESEGGAVEA